MFPRATDESPLKNVVTDPIRETRKIVLLRSAQIIGAILRAANTKELTTRVAWRSAWQNFRDAISLSLSLSSIFLYHPHTPSYPQSYTIPTLFLTTFLVRLSLAEDKREFA